MNLFALHLLLLPAPSSSSSPALQPVWFPAQEPPRESNLWWALEKPSECTVRASRSDLEMMSGRGAGVEERGKGSIVDARVPVLLEPPPAPSMLSTLAWVLALAVLAERWALREWEGPTVSGGSSPSPGLGSFEGGQVGKRCRYLPNRGNSRR